MAVDDPGLIAAFGGGMLSFFTPCVLPLVPGYLSLMSGVSTSQLSVATKTDTAKLLRSTLLFVAGFTVVFVALGAGASELGQLLNEHQRVLNRVAGVAVIVMGLFLAGAVSPRLLMQERRLHVSPDSLGGFAPPIMGMAFAFGWTPCIGPILAGVLALASDQTTVGRGMLLLLAYSLGLGVPFVASGVAFGRLTVVFDWMKRHFRAINLVSGLLLAAFGVLLFTDNVTDISRWLIERMDGVPVLDRLTQI